MPPAEPHLLRLYLHVGPGKTATSSIQILLERFAPELRRHGYFVPTSFGVYQGTHHAVAFLAHGLDLGFLDLPYDANLDEFLTEWVSEAKEAEAHTMVLSSELFSTCPSEGWLDFIAALKRSAKQAGVQVSEIVIFYTQRNFEERLRSQTIEGYSHGTTLPLDELEPIVATHLEETDRIVHSLPDLLPIPTRLDVIEMRQKSFLRAWFVRVFGEEALAGIPNESFDVRVNVGLGPDEWEWLRQFNLVSTPAEDLEELSPLVDLKTEARRLSHVRRRMVVPLLLENRALREELGETKRILDELQRSRAWRVTRPLRVVRSWFRKA